MRRRFSLAGLFVVVVLGAVIGIVAGTGTHHGNRASLATTTGNAATTSGAPSLPKNRCPLTDTPAPGGVVPQRIPLAVKIGNEPGPDAGGLGAARPQSGLNEADIVYDTPAEGGIMRYEAIYQCQDASSIGPVRSERWVDWHILAQFPKSILAHVGGIQPEIALLDAQPYVIDASAFTYPSDFHQVPSRVPPDATYTSTQALYGTFSSYRTPPPPIFRYTSSLPAGAKPVSSVEINFSQGTDATWKWDPSTGQFLHYYQGGVADIDALTNQQVSTTNIIIQVVHYHYGPWAESPGSTGDVESILTGTGTGYVLRNGEMIPVIWSRPSLHDTTTFTTTKGVPVGLAPGRTWVEIVLDTTAAVPGAITFTP
jgi:hypothetical protein